MCLSLDDCTQINLAERLPMPVCAKEKVVVVIYECISAQHVLLTIIKVML